MSFVNLQSTSSHLNVSPNSMGMQGSVGSNNGHSPSASAAANWAFGNSCAYETGHMVAANKVGKCSISNEDVKINVFLN